MGDLQFMKQVVGTETTYFITQINLEDNSEQFIEYNNYVGSFVATSDVDSATKFKSDEKAIDLAKLQNQMSDLLGKKFKYRVIKDVVTRTEVHSDIEEPEEPEEEESEAEQDGE